MRLTKQTNYAIRILMYCATNHDELSRIQDIAKAYRVSETFLFKILQKLVTAGFIMTTRGRSGGIRLAKPAREISLLGVVELMEIGFHMAECFEEEFEDCPLIGSCALNSALSEALNAFLNVLATHTIQSLVANRGTLVQLLGMNEPDRAALR